MILSPIYININEFSRAFLRTNIYDKRDMQYVSLAAMRQVVSVSPSVSPTSQQYLDTDISSSFGVGSCDLNFTLWNKQSAFELY